MDNCCIPKNIQLLNCESFWNKGYFGEDVTIGVMDSGCDINHIALKDRIVDTINFTNDGNKYDVKDYYGHGTHVTGIIAGNGCEKGIIGVAPKSNIVVIKVLNKNGTCPTSAMYDGILYSANNNIDILNISISGKLNSVMFHDTIKYAYNHGVILVASRGNGTKTISYPSGYNEVINVGACDFDEKIIHLSKGNTNIDLVSYGVDITSTFLDNQYCKSTGTSQATPHVTGSISLLINYFRDLYKRNPTHKEIYDLLMSYTIPISDVDVNLQGHGLLRLSL